MSDEQKRIAELSYALGLALGALQTVVLVQDFNRDGVKNIIERLEKVLKDEK